MNMFPHHSGRVAIITLLWALSGCNDAAPITPRALVVTAGDRQSGCFLHRLPDSLGVTLIGSDDQPFAAAPVAWQVTRGAATLSSALDTTDIEGESRVQLSLGAGVTAVAVTATVTGVPSASLSASGHLCLLRNS